MSACCTSCRSAWATPAGQEERRRPVVDLTPTVCSLGEKFPEQLKLPGMGDGLDWPRRSGLALSFVLPLRPPTFEHWTEQRNNNMPHKSRLTMPPSSFASGVGAFSPCYSPSFTLVCEQRAAISTILVRSFIPRPGFRIPVVTKRGACRVFRSFFIMPRLGSCRHHCTLRSIQTSPLVDYTKICNGSPLRGAAFQG